ncbi:thiol oxidoreductase [Amylibacter kogurei]|uniref:Thiol oxidoreductase n=1 Tax=Paramylibacter kogurei TaxID=1889778 RepID=A0A2G5KBT8_9RHOB|nr:di-heme oxidoredictase family protein [Amylibacter kogurei]PIB26639.1 thiol oxidoreductase [Amylibacter kogurei]
MKWIAICLCLYAGIVNAQPNEPFNLVVVPRTDAEIERVANITALTHDFTQSEQFESRPAGAASVRVRSDSNAFSDFSANLSFEDELDFKLGNALFRKLWVSSPSSTLASDGLGPLYNARSCQRCHLKDGRGHPPVGENDSHVSMLMNLSRSSPMTPDTDAIKDYVASLPDPIYGSQLQDFAIPGLAAEGQFEITTSDIDITLSDGVVVTLQFPTYSVKNLAYGDLHPDTIVAPRIAPQMIGLGLLEAIPAADILAHADPEDSNGDGISGRPNWVLSAMTRNVELGRFGLKATSPSILEQSATAFKNDIGISSTLFPDGWGDCTEFQNTCRTAPDGSTEEHGNVEISDEAMDLVNFYARNLGVPMRRDVDDPVVLRGKQVFYESGCAACHRPKFVTNRLVDQDAQSFQLIWPYTDMLLHDMGNGLADGSISGEASGNEWRTPPLWGIGLTQQVSGHTRFLHDGRARNLLEAILWHGGEGEHAKQRVIDLSTSDRDALLKFIESL